LRKLWDHKTYPKVKEACEGVDFDSKSNSAIDPVIESVSKRREKGEKLRKFTDTTEYWEYIKSFLEYCIPWLAFFIITLVLG